MRDAKDFVVDRGCRSLDLGDERSDFLIDLGNEDFFEFGEAGALAFFRSGLDTKDLFSKAENICDSPVENAFVGLEDTEDVVDAHDVVLGGEFEDFVNLGLLEDFLGRTCDEGNLLLQLGNAVGSEGVELDQHGLNRRVFRVGENSPEVSTHVLAEILCLGDVGENLFPERIDNRDGIDFREELGFVGWVPIDLGGLRRSGGHCSTDEH